MLSRMRCYSNSKRIQVFSGFSERIHIVLEEADETIFKQVNIYFLMLNFLIFNLLMLQIDDVVVSFDVLREKFLCNLDACKGECCIEGDAGAPVEFEEVEKLEEVLPVIWDELSPEARAVIDAQGVVYTDEEGDLVTSIVNNKDCVFILL